MLRHKKYKLACCQYKALSEKLFCCCSFLLTSWFGFQRSNCPSNPPRDDGYFQQPPSLLTSPWDYLHRKEKLMEIGGRKDEEEEWWLKWDLDVGTAGEPLRFRQKAVLVDTHTDIQYKHTHAHMTTEICAQVHTSPHKSDKYLPWNTFLISPEEDASPVRQTHLSH